MTLGDLIEVPPIRSVIQLADAERADLQEELLDRFVLTQDVGQLFERLLAALAQEHGLGAFIRGHYGSGKSHCLAFLHQLLRANPRAWGRLPEPLQSSPVRQQSWILVSVPLFAFSAEHSLEQVVFQALEDQLAAHLPQAPVLAESSRLLENFRTYVLPIYRSQLEDFEQLSQSAALRRARDFLRSLPDNPLRLSYDRRQAMQLLAESLGKYRIVLLLDELSEFLRSKQGSAHREDIRFLQFLGEWSDKLPLWIVASLQHSLEELGYGEEASALRIRERYPLRFHLSSRHVGDLISGRLIRHKAGAGAQLDKLWNDLNRLYPELIGRRDFMRIYPVHPFTLELLEQLTPLFSRQRGVVDFVHAQIAGDPLRGLPGMLQGPPDLLLTAERLFDHFQERLADRAELAAYQTSCWAYYERELPHLFSDDKARSLAAAVVKVLILAAIAPGPLELSDERLSSILARRLSRLDPRANLSFLREKVLDVLVERGAFVQRRGALYSLNLESNFNQLLGQKVRQVSKGMQADWAAAARLVNRPEMPLADIVGRPPQPVQLRWRQAPREGLWAWLQGDEQQLAAWQLSLDTDKYDCCLVVLAPGQPRPPAGPQMVIWEPVGAESDLEELLLDWQAHSAVMDRERELRPRLQPHVQQLQQRLEQRFFSLYARGRLHWGEQSGYAPAHETRFDRFYAAAVSPGLELRFPRFASIAPATSDCLAARQLETLWKELIEPGSGPVTPAAAGLLKPLGLLEEDRLAIQPGGPALAMLNEWQLGQRYEVQSLRRQWQKSSWGLLPAQFYVILACLVQLGKIQLSSHGRGFTLSSIRELLSGKAEHLEVLSQRELPSVESLQKLQWLFGDQPLLPLNQNRLRELWRQARERLLEWGELAALAPGERGRELREALTRVGLPNSSLQGLHALVEADFQRFAEAGPWLHFWSQEQAGLEQLRRRLKLLGQDQLLEQLAGLEHSSSPEREWGQVREQVRSYEVDRVGAYKASHDQYYQQEVFQLRRRLQASPEWRALESLQTVLGFRSQPAFAAIRQRSQALPQACRLKVEDQLLLTLVCACGYHPGQAAPEVPDLMRDLRQALSSGAREYLSHDLGPYLRNLHDLGQQALAERLERVLGLLEELPATAACVRLLEEWDRELAQHLSQAATGQTLLVRRPLRDLVERLQDQRLSQNQLRLAFEDWLVGPDLHRDAWVHVQLEEGAQHDHGGWVARWLRTHHLQPTPALNRRFDLNAPVSAPPPQTELWDTLLELSAQLEPVRAAQEETLFPDLSLRFCVQALQQGVPRGWSLPSCDWPHLAVFRGLTSGQFRPAARAWREWRKLAYERELEAELSPALVPFPEDAGELAEAPAALLDEGRWVILVVDALRWDLWDLLRPLFEGVLGVPLRELLVRAPLPSNTRAARHAWLSGDELVPPGADGLLLGRPLRLLKAADEKRKRGQVQSLLAEGLGALMLHLQFIDKRVHQSSLELWPLYRELLAEAEIRLVPLLRAIPPGRTVLLLSDHGFRDPGPHPPHGGDHWQEIYVPAALWRT
jgi:hypothetical protein